MSESTPEPERLDDTDAENAEILLADPDDYHKAQRLKEIHDARRRVGEQMRDLEVPEQRPGAIYKHSLAKLNHAIALYAEEILPLVKRTDKGPLELPDACNHDTVEAFSKYLGKIPKKNGDPVPPDHAMAVYRTCNEFLADVKPLITEDDTDEWEV